MAFIERCMGLKDNGTPIISAEDPDFSKIIPNRLVEWRMRELFRGRMTGAQFKAYFNIRTTVDASGRSDEQDVDALAAKAQGMSQLQRFGFSVEFGDLIALGSCKRATWTTPGYTTPAEIRAKLGI